VPDGAYQGVGTQGHVLESGLPTRSGVVRFSLWSTKWQRFWLRGQKHTIHNNWSNGFGGGIYIALGANISMDIFTAAQAQYNSPDNIHGTAI
jgi:hypothetical protein